MGDATRHRAPSSVVGDVQAWRAAMQVSPEDRRPTGAVQLQKAARTWQMHLDRPVAGDRVLALAGMGLAAQPAQPQPNQRSVRPNARRPAGGALPRRRRRAATAPFSHHRPVGRCPMIMPPPRCGGGSAGISPQRSPPRPTPAIPSPPSDPRGWLNSSAPTGPTPSSPACGGQRSLRQSTMP